MDASSSIVDRGALNKLIRLECVLCSRCKAVLQVQQYSLLMHRNYNVYVIKMMAQQTHTYLYIFPRGGKKLDRKRCLKDEA